MLKKTNSQSGLFNPRVLLAFALCSISLFLAMLSFAAPTLHTKKFPTRLPTIQPSTATMTLGSNSYAWGGNSSGQLGNGTTTGSATPQPVIMPAGVTFSMVSGGDRHSVALDTSGHAWAWGLGYFGQLGNGATSDSASPVAVSMPAGVTFKAIAAGGNHNLALDTSGNAWAWGSNGLGELGNGGMSDSATPTAVIMPPGVTFTAISAGFQGSLALDTTGKAWAWGSGIEGQLGNGLTTPNTPNPVPLPVSMPPGVTFIAIASGGQFDLALDTTGKAWAWGYNYDGELGNGTTNQTGPQCFCSTTPVAVSMPAGVTFSSVAAGGFFSVALDTSGNAWAWGYNGEGELGNGTTTDSATPVQVSMPAGITFSAIAAGGGYGSHSVALDTARKAWAWGKNGEGDIGDGTTINRTTPVAVSTPAGVTFSVVAVGASHSLALTPPTPPPAAAPWSWGDGNDGQTGNDDGNFGSVTPVPVSGLSGVTAIAGGGFHSIALKSDGTVFSGAVPTTLAAEPLTASPRCRSAG
jgi:alpha-tubulin suppressor-like RCC1 family protein